MLLCSCLNLVPTCLYWLSLAPTCIHISPPCLCHKLHAYPWCLPAYPSRLPVPVAPYPWCRPTSSSRLPVLLLIPNAYLHIIQPACPTSCSTLVPYCLSLPPACPCSYLSWCLPAYPYRLLSHKLLIPVAACLFYPCLLVPTYKSLPPFH